jgi:hypothetical protein
MTQTFTYDDIIRYVYNEMTEHENQQIEEAMLYDTELLTTYFECLDLKTALSQVILQPSDRCVQNIMAFSGTYGKSSFTVA